MLTRVARRLIPKRMRMALVDRLGLQGRSKDVFSRIYEEHAWGHQGHRFYSGDGSHQPDLVSPYVIALRGYLASRPGPIVVVDVGCGDFNVGRQLVDCADKYIACDVVPELIRHNRESFSAPNLEFRTLDAVTDELPAGDVVCVRQVLQHLTNVQIADILKKLVRYPVWVITEHVPAGDSFVPNVDKRQGRDIRMDTARSGVVLSLPPFSVKATREIVLCEVESYGGLIRTIAYEFV